MKRHSKLWTNKGCKWNIRWCHMPTSDHLSSHKAPNMDFVMSTATETYRFKKPRKKLDSCIVWNAYSTVIGSKRSAICAQLFTSSIRWGRVTWLNSRLRLAACDWVMSALSAVLSSSVGHRKKFGEVSCTECTGQGNNFELITMVQMETRNP